MSVHQARLTLAGLFVLLLVGLSSASRPPARRLPPRGTGDAFLHVATIDRIHAGERYYDAVGDELRRGHYPSTRVFNWRTPAHYLAVAALSVPVATALLKVLAFAAAILSAAALARETRATLVLGTAAQLGAVATAFRPMAVGVAEVWAGVFVALSLCAYIRRRWTAGAVLGLVALFSRELAAPYCVVCGLLAWRARRRSETYIWMAGAAAYVVYFAIHATQVWAHQLPGDLSQTASWIRWNGLAFTVETLRVNGWLGLAPRWAAVLYLIVALAAAVSTSAPSQATVAALTYFVLFAFMGQPFNYYWGFVTAPVWAFSVAYGIDGVRTLVLSSLGHDRNVRDREALPGV